MRDLDGVAPTTHQPVAGDGEPALRTTSLRDQAIDRLRSRIFTGQIVPGELYSVATLAEEFGASATPVREAIQSLAQEGLVRIRRNRGFVVAQLTANDLSELHTLREWLEIPAMELLAARSLVRPDEGWHRLAREVLGHAQNRDESQFLATNRRFHLQLTALLDNRRLVDFIARLRDETRIYRFTEYVAAGWLVRSASEHFELLDALIAGDPQRARQVMTQHLAHATRGPDHDDVIPGR